MDPLAHAENLTPCQNSFKSSIEDSVFESIETKTDALRRCGHERKEALSSLKLKLESEWTFHELALSGTPLARMDVRRMVEARKEPNCRSRTLREAYNFYRAIRYVDRCVPHAPRELSEADVLAAHGLLARGLNEKAAGRYRMTDAYMLEPGQSVAPEEIDQAMAETFAWLHGSSHQHPIRQATELQLRFVYVQPFSEMNGRLGRLLSNLVLMQRGLPPALLTGDDRSEYLDAIALAPKDGGRKLAVLLGAAVERTLDFCLEAVERAPALSVVKIS
jgi:Fic family protein